MLFSFLSRGKERITVPADQTPALFQAGWEWMHDADYPGAVLCKNGWEIPTAGGYVDILTAYRAGLSTHLTQEQALNEERILTDDELYEALSNPDTDPE